jgi:sugar lactone lactonase YvrE
MHHRARSIGRAAALLCAVFASHASGQSTIGSFLLADMTADFSDSSSHVGTLFMHRFAADTTEIFYNAPPLVTPYAIEVDGSRRVLVIDRNARIDGIVEGTGALFRIHPITREVELAVGSEMFRAPTDLAVLESGEILLVDREADPLGHGTGDTGAVFRIDPENGEVSVFSSPVEFIDPHGVVVDDTGAIYIVDENANPAAWDHDAGCVWEIDRGTGDLVRIVSADSTLSTPLDGIRLGDTLYVADQTYRNLAGLYTGAVISVDLATGAVDRVGEVHRWVALVDVQAADGTLYALDRDDGSGGTTTGSIFRIDLTSGDVRREFTSDLWAEPQAFAYFPVARSDIRQNRLVDLDGGRLNPRDSVRVEVVAASVVSVPTAFSVLDTIPAALEADGASFRTTVGGAELISIDPPVVEWTGVLQPDEAGSLEFDAVVGAVEPLHEEVRHSVELFDDGGGRVVSTVVDTIFRPLRPDEVLVADLVSFFASGFVAVLRGSQPTFEMLLHGPFLSNPSGVATDGLGHVFVADRDADVDSTGLHPGAIFRYAPERDEFVVLATDPTWIDPADVERLPGGDLVVLDIGVDGAGGGTGAIYRLEGETGQMLEVITDPRFVRPTDLAVTGDGEILVVDRDADPGGYGGINNGAIFRIGTDGSIDVDVFSPQFVDPSGITVITSTQYYIADRGADPFGYGTNTGAIFWVESHGPVTLFKASRTFVNPLRAALANDGRLLITDVGRAEILALDVETLDLSTYYAGELSIPDGVAAAPAPRFATSHFTRYDPSGPPILPGDAITYLMTLRNSGNLADGDVHVVNDLPEFCRIDESSLLTSDGEVSYDPSLNQVRWDGGVDPTEIVTVYYTVRVDDFAPMGGRMVSRAEITPSLVAPFAFADSAQVQSALLSGDLLVIDGSYAPPSGGRGALYRRNFESGLADRLLGGDPFRAPAAVVVDGERRAVVLDRTADPLGLGGEPGAIFRYDARLDELDVIASSTDFVSPSDLVALPDGRFVVADADADPFALGGEPGALFEVFPSGAVTPLASTADFVDPRAVARDRDGTLLVLDAGATLGGGAGTGALFRVNAASGLVTPLVSDERWTACADVVVGPDGGYFVLDAEGDPLGHGGDQGTVYRVDPGDLAVSIYSSDPALENPTSLALAIDGDLLVADVNAAGETQVWRVTAGSGSVSSDWEPAVVTDPVAIFVLDPPDISTSGIEVTDANGPPVLPGDRLRYRVVVRNNGVNPADPVVGTVVLSPLGTLDVASVSGDGVEARVVAGQVTFLGPVAPADSAAVTFDFEVAGGLDQGTRIETDVTLDAGNGVVVVLRDVQKTPFQYRPDDLLVLDKTANPDGIPGGHGAVFKWEDASSRLLSLSNHREFGTPEALLIDPLDPSLLYVADSRADPRGYGGDTGAVFRIFTADGQIERAITSPLFVNPVGVFVEPDGNLVVVDSSADPDSTGNHGALFSVDRESGAVSVLFSHAYFRNPRAGLVLPGRELLILDQDADPRDLGGDVGTIFRINRDDFSLRIAVTGGDLVDPSALAASIDGSVIVVDKSADPMHLGGDTGALLRYHPDADFVEPLASSPLFVEPLGAKVGALGEVYVADRLNDPDGTDDGRGAILRYHPSDGRVTVYAFGPELRNLAWVDFMESPTPVRFLALGASDIGGGRVRLTWEVRSTETIVGFDVYRALAGARDGSPEPEDRLNVAPLDPGERAYVDSTAAPGGTFDYWVGLTDAGGDYTLSGSVRVTLSSGAPAAFALGANRPNPFGRRTHVGFEVPSPGGVVTIEIFDLAGRRVRELLRARVPSGRHAVVWDGRDDRGNDVAQGIYFCRMRAPEFSASRRMVRLR